MNGILSLDISWFLSCSDLDAPSSRWLSQKWTTESFPVLLDWGLPFQLGKPKDSLVVHPHLLGFRISLLLSKGGTIFRDEIDNYFSCSHLPRRDRDYHMTIIVFRDENEITYCYSHVSRRDRDFWKSFLVVVREKTKLTLVENSWDREFSLNSDWECSSEWYVILNASTML